MCRFASVCMTFALNVVQFDLLTGVTGSVVILGILLVVPPCMAVAYSTYVLNPKIVVQHMLNEIRLFLHKRQVAQQQQAEATDRKRQAVYQAARSGNAPQLKYLLTKHEDDIALNWAVSEDEDDNPERGFTPFHVAAAHGNALCLSELFMYGLFTFNQQQHTAVLSPLQLAWKNGCGRCVEMLTEMGFEEINPAVMEPRLQTSGLDLLHDNIVSALISAGHHLERGSDMEWILNHQGNYDQTSENVDLDQKAALKMVFASLVMEHQWDGLAALAAAIELNVLDLWDEWVNLQVIYEVVRAAPGIHCLKVDGATIGVQDLEQIATSAEFSHTCVVFHGTPSAGGGSQLVQRKSKTARDLVKKLAYGETSWSIAGVSRLLQYLKPGGKHETHVKAFSEDLHELEAPRALDFQPPMKERPVGGKQYRSHLFSTDESDDPHQWILALENWGNELAVFLQYSGRPSVATTSGSLYVTASLTITCTSDKKLLYGVGSSASVKNVVFSRGENIHVGSFCVDCSKDLIELRVLDVFVMETTSLSPDCVDWRITGLNTLMDQPVTLFSDTFKATESNEPWQMAIQIPKRSLPANSMLHIDEAYFKQTGVPVAKFSDAMAAAILTAFTEFLDDEKLLAMELDPNCDSSARKFCHQTAEQNLLEHSTQTDENSGVRSVCVFKPDGQDCVPIEASLRRCDVSLDHTRRCSAAIRIEHESTQRNALQCLGHAWLDVSETVTVVTTAQEGSLKSLGCALAYRRDLMRGDRSEVVHVKLLVARDTAGVQEARYLGKPWRPDAKDRAWMMEALKDQHMLKHQHTIGGMRKLLIAPDDFLLPDEVLTTMIGTMEECTAKPGTEMLTKGKPCDEFLYLLDGSCRVAGGGAERVETGQVPLSRLCDMVLGLGASNRQTVIANDHVKYLRLDAGAFRAARFAAASPITFPEAAFHTVSPCGTPGKGQAEGVTWKLHRPADLLSDGSFVPLASDWFRVATLVQTRWRLHLIPVRDVNLAAPMVAFYLSCDRADTMTTTQQMRARFTTSLVSGDSDRELESGNLQQRGQHEIDPERARELVHTFPGERLWGGAQFKYDELLVQGLSLSEPIEASDARSGSAMLRLDLSVPGSRKSRVGIAGAAKGFMVAGLGRGGEAESQPERKKSKLLRQRSPALFTGARAFANPLDDASISAGGARTFDSEQPSTRTSTSTSTRMAEVSKSTMSTLFDAEEATSTAVNPLTESYMH
jgi:hypothetical protein